MINVRRWRRWAAIALLAFALAGCASPQSASEVAATIVAATAPSGTAPSALPDVSTAPAPSPEVNPTPQITVQVPAAASGNFAQLPPYGPQALLDAFLSMAGSGDSGAVRRMMDSGDPSYIPVLVDFLRFSNLLSQESRFTALFAIAALSGDVPGELTSQQLLWDWWANWVGEHSEVNGPLGYAAFKGMLLSQIVDPAMEDFLYDGVKKRIRLEEIVWGGVAKDGIPDLTNPLVITAAEADYLFDADRVFGVSFNGEHRAYPLRILNAHEMANDVVGGVPFALAY